MTSFGVESSGGTLFAESLMPNRAKAPLSVLVVSAAQVFILAQVPPPPPTPRDNVREVIHGVEIVDPYRWLEDQDGPQTREWIAAQNSYTRSLLNPLPMRERIYERLMDMHRHDSISEPEEENGRYFFMKRAADQDLWSIYVRKGSNGPDELLIDPQPLSSDQTTSVTFEGATQDGKMLAYGVRRGGEDETEIQKSIHHRVLIGPRTFFHLRMERHPEREVTTFGLRVRFRVGTKTAVPDLATRCFAPFFDAVSPSKIAFEDFS